MHPNINKVKTIIKKISKPVRIYTKPDSIGGNALKIKAWYGNFDYDAFKEYMLNTGLVQRVERISTFKDGRNTIITLK